MYDNLKFKPIAIGSLPHNNVNEAMELVKHNFYEIPFFPQLANFQKNEDMIVQFLEGFPGVNLKKGFLFDSESDEFFVGLEEFFSDYQDIIENHNYEKLGKYAISENFSSTFPHFIDIIQNTKPQYAKGQIVGPFTLSAALTDINGKSLVFDETLTDIITKLLSLKTLWQIQKMKEANPSVIPIIFMDEPTISQLGTSAYVTIKTEDVQKMLNEICLVIHENCGICAIHCCGKCDWSIALGCDIDIINFDAYSFAQNISLYSNEIDKFLKSGGKLAWGVVPTLDGDVLKKISVNQLVENFENCLKYLTNKGIDEKLITDNSIITSSCGAGALSVELAKKAMDLVKELSNILREKY